MKFILTTISGTKYDGEVAEVVLPTIDGRIGVLDHHMPLFGVITNGVIAVRINKNDADSKLEYFASSAGALEVADNCLKVIVDEATRPDEINEIEAQDALDLAIKMKAEAKDETSLEKAQAMVDRQAVRLKVASLKKRKY